MPLDPAAAQRPRDCSRRSGIPPLRGHDAGRRRGIAASLRDPSVAGPELADVRDVEAAGVPVRVYTPNGNGPVRHPRVVPRRRVGDRQRRRQRRDGAGAGRRGRRRGRVGRVPPRPRAPLPGRGRRLPGRDRVGAGQRRRARRRSGARRRRGRLGRRQPGRRRQPAAPAVGWRCQLLVYPATDAVDEHAVVHRERRGLPAHAGVDGVVLRALPGRHRRRGDRRAPARRWPPATAAACRRPWSSPPSSTRCATRARPTPTSWRPPASRSRRAATTA